MTRLGVHRPARARLHSLNRFGIGCLTVAASMGLSFAGAASAQSGAANSVGLGPNIPFHSGHPGAAASPVSAGWQSTNWSGYAETSKAPYSGISGQWNVPTASPTIGRTYSAAWVGIDGFNNNSLIQTGTEQDYYNGAAHYAAWWTTSAQGFLEQRISKPVGAGDAITAHINQVGTTKTWTIILADATRGWSFTKTLTYSGPRASAEWILEAPGINGSVANLAHYGKATFDPGTIDNGASPSLSSGDSGSLVKQTLLGTTVVSTPSAPDSDVDGFNVAYGSTTPSPPSS